MSTNFRSTQSYVDAMNTFFTSQENFFADEGIEYIDVTAGKSEGLGTLEKNNIPATPIDFVACAKNDDQHEAIAFACLDLLQNHTIKGNKVKPSNIGILVKSKKLGADIKRELGKAGIPAVVIDDTKVIETEEALYIQYLLEAMLYQTRNTIHKALLTPLFGARIDDVLHLDDIVEQHRFQQASKAYEENGIYTAIMLLLDIYNVKGVLLTTDETTASRRLSNIYQLAELCQKKVLENQYDLEKLLSWLTRERQNIRDSKEGYELRIESDEQAVKIVTIHKSKGLAYDIVIAPSMQLSNTPFNKATTLTYQNEESLDYEFSLDVKNEKLTEIYQDQREKENRRLMYVTLTRAKYKAIVVHTKNPKDAYMTQMLPNLQALESTLFDFTNWEEQTIGRYKPEKIILDKSIDKVEHLKKFTNSWRLMSYSMISKTGEHYAPQEITTEPNDYDTFVFENMPRGAGLGNFVHYLFENIDFANTTTFDKWLTRGESLFGKKIINEEMRPFYTELINEVLGAKLETDSTSFSLNTVTNHSRLNELQFYFDIDEFRKTDLSLFDKPVDMDLDKYKGYFQGFIDLVFEHEGKFYILDWKSNYLGNSTGVYSHDHLDKAMTANNYHLQYFIYTIALVRYLKSRMPDFDYDKHYGGAYYLFLRGCRKDETSGVFHHKPSWESVVDFV